MGELELVFPNPEAHVRKRTSYQDGRVTIGVEVSPQLSEAFGKALDRYVLK